MQEESARLHFCDVCEKLVGSAAEYKQHVAEHATCGIDGCGYTAHQVRGKHFTQTKYFIVPFNIFWYFKYFSAGHS